MMADRKKLAFYALAYLATGYVVNVVLLLVSVCRNNCPGIADIVLNVTAMPAFWGDVLVWPLKLAVFLARSIGM